MADRDMASERNLSLIEKEGYGYIVGAKTRHLRRVRDKVLSFPGRCRKIDDNLKVKRIFLQDRRYIICSKSQEAEKDRMERGLIIENLEKKIKTGCLSRILTGDAKRFCQAKEARITLSGERTEKEVRYDGKYVS